MKLARCKADFSNHYTPVARGGPAGDRTHLALSTELIDRPTQLVQFRDEWNALDGGMPFRSHEWLTTWWNHYGEAPRQRLHVIALRDDEAGPLVGLAPWYLDHSRTRGEVLRPLGGGEVCSDHRGILCTPSREAEVARSIACYLSKSDAWNRLELDAVDESDVVIQHLSSELAKRDCEVSTRGDGNCWSVDLPATWDEFLALQSKSHRKQLRRAADRVLDTPRCQWHAVESLDDFREAWPIFVDLHQRRRTSLGEPGCFASDRFTAFHTEVAPLMLAAGRLRLGWLELDGSPAAAEYHFAGLGGTYAYQGGVDPDRLDDEPGRLSNIATIRRAIEQKHTAFDFLRGDEPYKAHWRATPQPTYRLRVVAPRHSHNWLAQTADWADSMASVLKASLRPLVAPTPVAK